MNYMDKDFSGTAAAAALILNDMGIGAELISVILEGVEDLSNQEYTALRLIRSRLRRLEDKNDR